MDIKWKKPCLIGQKFHNEFDNVSILVVVSGLRG